MGRVRAGCEPRNSRFRYMVRAQLKPGGEDAACFCRVSPCYGLIIAGNNSPCVPSCGMLAIPKCHVDAHERRR